jgi:hypothetical protein
MRGVGHEKRSILRFLFGWIFDWLFPRSDISAKRIENSSDLLFSWTGNVTFAPDAVCKLPPG